MTFEGVATAEGLSDGTGTGASCLQADSAKAAHAAKEYEGVFIAQLLGTMFSGIKTDGLFGGGQGEEMFRSLLVDQYAKGITAQGGFGLAAHMQAELLKHQGTQ